MGEYSAVKMFHNRLLNWILTAFVVVSIILTGLYLSCSTAVHQLRRNLEEFEGRIGLVSNARGVFFRIEDYFLVNGEKSSTGEDQ